jgi:hypothetical protein
MTDERRYTDDEVAFILQQASTTQETPTQALPSSTGLTLAQLQEIGSEVGIDPQAVARAAESVARGNLVPTRERMMMGVPVGVSRTIELGRAVSDAEWDRMVVTFRETFGARGHVWREGGLRQWANGNLQALLEPTPTGHRLRLATRNANYQILLRIGTIMATVAVAMAVLLLVSTKPDRPFWVPFMWGSMGLGSIVSARLRLPKWAQERASQMESIAQRMTEGPPRLPGS